MHKVAKVVLKGYREWTESLGDDREWIIQKTQAELERVASLKASECGAFYLPSRKDVLFFVLNGVEERCFDEVLEALREESPVPLEAEISCGSKPLEALLEGRPCPSSTAEIAAVHVDINSFTSKEHYLGYVESVQLLESMLKVGLGFGAIGSYLGGDNVILFADPSDSTELARVISSMYDVKVGIGIAGRPREALALAAKALRKLRKDRREKVVIERQR